jgi:hypothetical protein
VVVELAAVVVALLVVELVLAVELDRQEARVAELEQECCTTDNGSSMK